MSGAEGTGERLRAKFLAVAGERLGRLDSAVAALGRGEADAPRVAEAMREIHTLKGEAKMMGFDRASAAAHRVEDVLLVAKARGFDPADGSLGLATLGLDLVRSLIDTAGDEDTRAAELADFEAAVRSELGAAADDENRPASTEHNTLLSPTTESSAVVTPNPPADAPPTEGPASTVPERPPTAANSRPVVTRPGGGGTIRVDVAAVDAMSHLAAELGLLEGRQSGLLSTLHEMEESLSRGDGAARGSAAGAGHPPGRAAAAEPPAEGPRTAEKLRRMAAAWRDTLFELRTHLDALDARLDELRLVPLSVLLERFPAAIRALARQQGKQVEVSLRAGAVAVDHRVVDELGEPLLHLVRNAVDHGIERPADRRAAGKPVAGQVSIAARTRGDMVEIMIADDGAGIDLDRLRATAITGGQLSAEQVAALDDDELLALIFRAGLSTRKGATDISGRGVGLDAVKHATERLGGWIAVDNDRGRGTRFRLGVPVHVAIQKVLVLRVADVLYGLPSRAVHRVLLARADQLWRAGNGKVLHADELIVPVVDLPAMLGQPAGDGAETAAPVVVLQHAGHLVGLLGASPQGERAGLRRPLDPFVRAAGLVAATTVLDHGELVLLLNVPALYRQAMRQPGNAAAAGHRQRQRPPTLLIVDDSDLTRDMLVALTRGQGFHIVEAVNGREALDRVQAEPPDVVMTDLDMPVMDGFALMARLRAMPATQHTPIIVLSTRGSDEDKRRAMEAGASSYLVKSRLDEAALASMLVLYAAAGPEGGAAEASG